MKNNNSIHDSITRAQQETIDYKIQEVKPVKESINKDMVQCNFNIRPDLKNRLKLRAIQEGVGYKEIITTLLEEYLQ